MLKQKAKNILATALGSSVMSRDKINLNFSCPECDSSKSKKKLSIRLDDFRYHCWVCGIKGQNIWRYISKKYPEIHIDAGFLGKKRSKTSESDVDQIKPLEKPLGLVPVFRSAKDPDVNAVRRYLKSRGISMSDMTRWRIMTTQTGRFRRRAIVPSFDLDGKMNYYVGRSIDEDSFKYLNAKVSKHDMIFNEIDIAWNKTVVLVEGVLDAMKSVENSIPILGSTLPTSSRLFKMLMKYQSDVIVSLDPDLKQKAYKIAKDLYTAGCNVRICFTPDGKDMGELSKNENREMLKTAINFSPYISITHKINSIRSGSII